MLDSQSQIKGRYQNEHNREEIPLLSIVLVCWNNKSYLNACLQSLYRTGLKSTFDVIVVDNGSTDGSQKMLEEKYREVKIIQNAENLGLGKASNQGIENTKGKYILLLNNDTIVNGQSFDAMIEFLEQQPKAGAVGGKLLNPDGTTQAGYNYFSSLFQEFLVATRLGELIRPGYPAVMDGDEIRSVDWMGSACLMVRRSALDEVGLLDEGYFIYGDETDLQYRLKKAGWDVYYLPEVTTIHYGGRSMNRWSRRKMVYRGKMLFYQKHYGFLQTLFLRLLLGILSLAKSVVWAVMLILPQKQDLARKELRSNFDVIGFCFTLK
jgi:N-acetylglucosaminyl-diphospho-decaprenol L-rhamnosyltransferase